MSEAKTVAAPSLAMVRQRIDALDAELLRLVDERASLARASCRARSRVMHRNKPGSPKRAAARALATTCEGRNTPLW